MSLINIVARVGEDISGKFSQNLTNPGELLNPKPRNGISNSIVLFGESSSGTNEWIAARFDPATGKNDILARLTYRKYAAVVTLGNGETLILGGLVDGKASSSVEVFVKKQSSPVAHLTAARRLHGACAVGDAVIVCGGLDGRLEELNSCEVYSRSEDRWRMLPEMRERRAGVAVVSALDRRVFAIGGWNEEWRDLSSVEVCRLPDDFASFPPSSAGFWRSLAPMREARRAPAAVLFQTNIFVAGGYKKGCLSSVEVFPIDKDDGQWVTYSASMEKERFLFFLLATNDELFAFGNYNSPENSVERLKLEKSQNSDASSLIDGVASAQWESLPPVASMKRIWGAVQIPEASL